MALGLPEFLAMNSQTVLDSAIQAAQTFVGNTVCPRGAARVLIYMNVATLAIMTQFLEERNTEFKQNRPLTDKEVQSIYEVLLASIDDVRQIITKIEVTEGDDKSNHSMATRSPSNHRH